jgi:hypothetical protein
MVRVKAASVGLIASALPAARFTRSLLVAAKTHATQCLRRSRRMKGSRRAAPASFMRETNLEPSTR